MADLPAPASPSVQSVRPTPRELSTSAITRDREQGRAADAALRRDLRDIISIVDASNGGQDADDLRAIGKIAHHALALTAPLAPATTGMKETR